MQYQLQSEAVGVRQTGGNAIVPYTINPHAPASQHTQTEDILYTQCILENHIHTHYKFWGSKYHLLAS